jgi:hypothetical protein
MPPEMFRMHMPTPPYCWLCRLPPLYARGVCNTQATVCGAGICGSVAGLQVGSCQRHWLQRLAHIAMRCHTASSTARHAMPYVAAKDQGARSPRHALYTCVAAKNALHALAMGHGPLRSRARALRPATPHTSKSTAWGLLWLGGLVGWACSNAAAASDPVEDTCAHLLAGAVCMQAAVGTWHTRTQVAAAAAAASAMQAGRQAAGRQAGRQQAGRQAGRRGRAHVAACAGAQHGTYTCACAACCLMILIQPLATHCPCAQSARRPAASLRQSQTCSDTGPAECSGV